MEGVTYSGVTYKEVRLGRTNKSVGDHIDKESCSMKYGIGGLIREKKDKDR